MKYGIIAKNRSINAAIYRCFDYVVEEDARAFVRKLAQQEADEQQQMHTFRELLLGGFLGKAGLAVRHEHMIDEKTPDWAILDTRVRPVAIVELTNFHADRRTELAIEKAKEERGFWVGWGLNNSPRLRSRLEDKANVYRALVEKHAIAYAVAVFCEFEAGVERDEIEECLNDEETGLFVKEPSLSGVLTFEENAGRYSFQYSPNPYARRSLQLPSTVFP